MQANKTVYAIQNKTTKRIYIGCTVDPQMRIRSHFSELEKGLKKSRGAHTQWQTDYNEFGKKDFDIFVIEENIPADQHVERENYYIKTYDTLNPNKGYNLTPAPKEPILFIYGKPEFQS